MTQTEELHAKLGVYEELKEVIDARISELRQLVQLHDVAGTKLFARNKLEATPPANYEELMWIPKDGARGPYEQASRQNSKVDVFAQLQAELKAHGGFWQHGEFRYWFHREDPDVIDRRKVRVRPEG